MKGVRTRHPSKRSEIESIKKQENYFGIECVKCGRIAWTRQEESD